MVMERNANQTKKETNMKMSSNQQTARDAYKQHSEDIARVMDWIELELDKHKTNAKAKPNDWGYPGELASVRQKLIETLAFLSNIEPKDIENLLSDIR